MKEAVIGAGSMVGSRFCELSINTLIQADLEGPVAVDITSYQSVDSFFKNHDFEWVNLFSAYTAVDEAEKQRGDKNGSAWRINVEGVENVVRACQRYHRGLIFFSTDFVFDGTAGPYTEDDQVGIDLTKVSWYGLTKIEAEKRIQSSLANFIILRISYPYRRDFANKTDFARSIITEHKAGTLTPRFDDQIITPTFVDDVPRAVELLLDGAKTGIFHLASPQVTTPYEFACSLIEAIGESPQEIKKASIVEFLNKGNTPRPQKGGLKVAKITEAVGLHPTSWQDGIKEITTN